MDFDGALSKEGAEIGVWILDMKPSTTNKYS